MNIIIMLTIILANAIAIAVLYQFVKKLNKRDKLIFIGSCVAIVYILITIVYWISGFGIDEKIHEECKSFVTYMFVKVVFILFMTFVDYNYMKFKDKKRTGFPVLFPHMVIVCSYLQISLAILSANTLVIQSKMNMATNLPSSLNCRIVPIKLITAQIYIILLLFFWYSTTNAATRIIPYAK